MNRNKALRDWNLFEVLDGSILGIRCHACGVDDCEVCIWAGASCADRLAIDCSFQNLLDPCGIVFAADDIVHGISGLPKHDTTKLGVLVEATDKLVGIGWVKVVVSAVRCVGVCGKADVDPCLWVEETDLGPLRKGDIGRLVAIDVVDTGTSRAVWSVVKLNKQEVEPNILNKTAKVSIWNDTLR